MQLLNFIISQFCNLSIFQSCNLILFQSYNLSSINNTILLRQTRTPINRLLYVAFFTFLFSLFSFSYGQVKIKEKVEIKPRANRVKLNELNGTTTTNTLTVTKNNAPGDYVGLREHQGGSCSGEYLAHSPNGGTITAPVIYGNIYCITFKGSGSLQAYLDGVLILDETISGYGFMMVTAVYPPCGEDAPECDGEQEIPEINAENEGPIYSLCDKQRSDGILRGAFSKSWNWPYKPINVLACFNKQTNKWQYEISENKIILKYNLTICYENLNSLYPNLIGNLNDLYTIPKNDFCLAVRNFEKQYKYGGGRGNTYYIVEATVKHEERHRDDYLRMLNKLKNEFDLPNKIVEYNPDCNEIDNYKDALQKGAENIRDKLRNFIRKFKDKWTEWKDSFSSYEQYTQDRIHSIIDEYIRQLESIYNLKREDCK